MRSKKQIFAEENILLSSCLFYPVVIFRYGQIFRERFLSEEFVYVSEPKDVAIIAQNEGRTPCRPHIEAMMESRKQDGYPIGISAMQGIENLTNEIGIIFYPRIML